MIACKMMILPLFFVVTAKRFYRSSKYSEKGGLVVAWKEERTVIQRQSGLWSRELWAEASGVRLANIGGT